MKKIGRYTQEEVEAIFDKAGCKLLGEYINVKTPIEYIAKCGHQATTTLDVFSRARFSHLCPACSPKVSYTPEQVAMKVRSEGCELLSLDKVGKYKVVTLRCKECGEPYSLTFEKFCAGRGRICSHCSRSGERHFAYNPSISDEQRTARRDLSANIKWRTAVYVRDGYTCQVCGDDTGGNLVAHHLYGYADYPDKRFDTANGVTLCESCHKSFHHSYGYGHNTKVQFMEWLKQDNTEITQETKESCAS